MNEQQAWRITRAIEDLASTTARYATTEDVNERRELSRDELPRMRDNLAKALMQGEDPTT